MNTFLILLKRNIKLFFKDKGMFLTSLITPLILLVLYVTFLGNIYKESYTGLGISDELVSSLVSGQLISSILAVSCVTVAFSSNFLIVQDKVTTAINDLKITPVKSSTLSLSYYFASLASTFIICFVALGAGFIYMGIVGWYLSVADVLLLVLDVFLLVMFGTALSSVINYFLSSQGQISAVGSIVSSCYGFICGAYMPIATFSTGLQNVLSFLPGTYGTSLLRNHAVRGALKEAVAEGLPQEAYDGLAESLDMNVFFLGKEVGEGAKYIFIASTTLVLILGYVLINKLRNKKSK